jgi:hypothetical protein
MWNFVTKLVLQYEFFTKYYSGANFKDAQMVLTYSIHGGDDEYILYGI